MHWYDLIIEERTKEYYQQLMQFLDVEYERTTVYPPRLNIFNAFILAPFNKIKVVWINQDPYINGEATGLALSVSNETRTPPTLKNILKELKSDLGIDHQNDLSGWAREGVLLLNTVMTVEAGKSLSHVNKGWETFTDVIIKKINSDLSGVVFLLCGRPAQSKKILINQDKHFIIETSHFSPLAATKTDKPAIGSKCFSRINNILIEQHKIPIDWSK